ncbi:MAG: adenylosuccinate lyase [Planctomycetes bacterium]|nr:adenylosuccinate lyase [Planctomycetota bacterium]
MADEFQDPIAHRYASAAMREIFSPRRRALVWRDIWIALAEAQHELGLAITPAQLRALRERRDHIDVAAIAAHEQRLRHDVMAHIHAYGEAAPEARGILHWGATSCDITDNGDLILMRDALRLVAERLLRMIHALAAFAGREARRPTLGLTHLQPAQLTTVGKRAALWIQDLVGSWESLVDLERSLPFRGIKGATGTQGSFLQLFRGKGELVAELDRRVAAKMAFSRMLPLAGQTYPRVLDFRLISRLGELAVVLHKFSTDLRLLQSFGEIEEPLEKSQVGSSAMPHKRNPMRCERIGALAKMLLGLAPGFGMMAATQWMERSLDDSAMRRTALPQAFLIADALLVLGLNVARGLTVHPAIIEHRIEQQLPFLAAEELMLEGVAEGGNRQELHERLRGLAWQASESVQRGEPNPLRALLEGDSVLGPLVRALPPWRADRFIGLAPQQTTDYLESVVAKLPQPAAERGDDEIRV